MAERWQQWMPHDIDAWQGSANVQALSDLAYRAVHNLILDMWKQPDCSLPLDEKELSKRSRVAHRWSECREEVLDYFSDRTEDGKITHRVTVKKWHEAREKYESNKIARSEAGKLGAAKRWHGKPIANAIESHSKPMAKDGNSNTTSTETEQVQEPKQKPSRGKREDKVSDPRHTPFKNAFWKYFAHKNNGLDAPWHGRDGKALADFLVANPKFTNEQWQCLLNHRARSSVIHAESLHMWIGRALMWANGPSSTGKPSSGGGNGVFENKWDRARRLIDEEQDEETPSDSGGITGSAAAIQ